MKKSNLARTLLSGVLSAGLMIAAGAASAVTVTNLGTSPQGAANTAGIAYAVGFGGFTPAGASFSEDPLVSPPPGNLSGVFQSPFNSNVLTDTQSYFSAGAVAPNGQGASSGLVLTLGADVDSFTLLWGSIDSYNTLTFLDAADATIDSFTGTELVAALSLTGVPTNFEQVVLAKFDIEGGENSIRKLRFDSSQAAFEFALAPVPVPAALPLFASALIGVSLLSRRRRKVSYKA